MGTKITSHNQSGGITAKNVNVAGTGQPEPAARPWKKIAGWAVGLAAFLASVVAVLEYVGVKLW